MLEPETTQTGGNNKLNDKGTPPQSQQPILSRTDVLRMLGECIISVHKKLRTGRNRNAEKDKIRDNMLRCQGYISNVYLQGLKDLELQELQDRIEKLETARGHP